MRMFINRLPIPVGCVALGFTGLATLFAPIHHGLLYIFLFLSLLLLLPVLLKLIMVRGFLSVNTDDISLSTLSGASMTMMLSSVPLHTVFGWRWPIWFWAAGVALHLLVLVLFSVKLFRSRNKELNVRGCWLLVYVGIAAASISAPAFSLNEIGRFFLCLSALGAIVLLPLVYHGDRNLPGPQKPFFCISTAPVSIWLVALLSVYPDANKTLVAVLLILSQLLYIPALARFARLRGQAFSPAFASFTFPFVISATAFRKAAAVLVLPEWLKLFQTAEMFVALALCCFVLWKYLCFLFPGQKDLLQDTLFGLYHKTSLS